MEPFVGLRIACPPLTDLSLLLLNLMKRLDTINTVRITKVHGSTDLTVVYISTLFSYRPHQTCHHLIPHQHEITLECHQQRLGLCMFVVYTCTCTFSKFSNAHCGRLNRLEHLQDISRTSSGAAGPRIHSAGRTVGSSICHPWNIRVTP